MKTFNDLVAETAQYITEIMPWDLEQKLESNHPPLIVDVREQQEFDAMHMANALFVPRGILETACDYDYDTTIPKLASARNQEVVVVCRSGNRSVMAAHVMQQMGFHNVSSLKTGIRGWNDYDQPLFNAKNELVDPDSAEISLRTELRPDQKSPQ